MDDRELVVPGRDGEELRAALPLLLEAALMLLFGVLGAAMLVFFIGFNMLEATQPSLASRVAPVHARGAAMGVYNTLQSLGFFAGGALGGWLAKNHGPTGVFAVCAGLMLLWLLVAWPMRAPAPAARAAAT